MQEGEVGDIFSREMDLAALKGLAHPLRVQILDALTTYGPATASMLAERFGESSGATSYHLRQLARHDFVREVKGRGSARERWWERIKLNITVPNPGTGADPASEEAARLIDREWERTRQHQLAEFANRGGDLLPREWMEASELSTADAFLTVHELRHVVDAWNEHVVPLILRYIHTENPPGSRPVQVHFNAFPIVDGKEIPHEQDARTAEADRARPARDPEEDGGGT